MIEKLGLITEFENCKKIISATHGDNKFSKEVKNLIKEILNNFNWKLEKQKKIKIFVFDKKNRSSTKFLERLFRKIYSTSHHYQLPKTSLKFWFYFFRDLFFSLKRISF